jgi:general secretion pathway protein A
VGGHEYGFPLSEIDRVWDGSFTILWKRPFDLRRLVPGTQGEDVIWIRRALDTLEKKATPATVPDLYDDELQKRIVAFQRDQSLIQDGSVGKETLVRLTLALDGPNAPSLSGNAR